MLSHGNGSYRKLVKTLLTQSSGDFLRIGSDGGKIETLGKFFVVSRGKGGFPRRLCFLY